MATLSFTNLGEFTAGLDDEIEAVDKLVLSETQDAATVALQVAVDGTPVDTGENKGSYIVGIGSDPGPSGNPLDPDGGATIAAGNEIIATAQAYEAIIIMNDGPVIEELNDGLSHKMPAGFLDDAVLAAGRSK